MDLSDVSWRGGSGTRKSQLISNRFLDEGKILIRCVSSSSQDKIPVERITLLAAYGASTTTRTASRLTFEKKKRSMQTTDLLKEVGAAFEATFGEIDGANVGKL